MVRPNCYLQTKTARFLIVITLIIAVLFLSAAVSYAQSMAFVGIETITCDETGYSLTITPDPNWTQSWCSAQGFTYLGPPVDWCYDIGPPIVVYQVPPVVIAGPPAIPGSHPLTDTWSNLGKDTATIYYSIGWTYYITAFPWIQEYYPPRPAPWIPTSAEVIINKSDCMIPPSSQSCELTPRYYMYTLQDANQTSRWAEYCYIISGNGYPNVDIQAKLCTPTGSEHTFRATNIPFGGWVSTDCQGNAFYGWPEWDASWYRSTYAK